MPALLHRVIWTVLPRGMAHGRAELVAMASVRLLSIPAGPGLMLHDYPAFLDWPKASEAARFRVFVDDHEVETTRTPDPLAAGDDGSGSPSRWWQALFGPKTPVVSHAATQDMSSLVSPNGSAPGVSAGGQKV